MGERLKGCLDARPFCLLTRPLAGLVLAGAVGGAFGALGGLVYGAFHGAPQLALSVGLHAALAGAAVGFIMGLWSGVDRVTWPADESGLTGRGDDRWNR